MFNYGWGWNLPDGVPKYQEVNPALFTIVTFPFLFGMMFGDIGHGGLLFLVGCLLIWNADKLKNHETFGAAVPARYLLALMGFFACYTGWIYNDCASVSINAAGSRWTYLGNATAATRLPSETNLENVYPFGLDPAWHGTSTQLAFTNSLKMKLAVTVGVIQMTFGLVLSVFNHAYFKDHLSIYCEFIPQMLFLMALFGYMIILVLVKWSIDWTKPVSFAPGCNSDRPNLITTMVWNTSIVSQFFVDSGPPLAWFR